MLEHEGSTAPRDPKNPKASSVVYVLDIKDIALQPNRDVSLTIRKPEERRKCTQTWQFVVSCLRLKLQITCQHYFDWLKYLGFKFEQLGFEDNVIASEK